MEYSISLDTQEATGTHTTRAAEDASRACASLPRVAVVCDLREENWPSMNLVADMLLANLREQHAHTVASERVCPPMRRRFTRAGWTAGAGFNVDRLLNRFLDYPRSLRRLRGEFDLFHVLDHSYAQLVHQLPPERTIVTCHDLDTFRCLLEPASESRSAMFKMMTRRVLEGFRRAARVTCDSAATRDELLSHKLFPPERLTVIPNGVHTAFSTEPDAGADREAERLLGVRDEHSIELLHVGSAIERKRIDVLLKVFAEVWEKFPRARLVRAGGALTTAQDALARRLNLDGAIVTLPFLKTETLAAVYRRAALVLQPSEREGFGLPLVEALACGTPVVASRLPVLEEVGGTTEAVTYCPVGDTAAWSKAVIRLLSERRDAPERWTRRREAGVRHASQFTWEEYAARMAALYREVLGL
ncbi:MAG: glycosyltransferase family 4 protein [Acidobacteria bacterium]|nr:glycosyltransferase family 4 protein [Acidobacteriota bacterium]